jgi:hypothetical protein
VALGRKIRGATDIGEIGNPKAVYRIHRDGVVVYTEWVLGGVGVRRRADQKIQPAFFFLPRYKAARSGASEVRARINILYGHDMASAGNFTYLT